MSRRPRVLVELGVELDRAARKAGRRPRIRLRGPQIVSRDGMVALLAIGCALGVAGFAIIALGHGRPPTSSTAAHRAALPRAPRRSGDLRAWFAALRRPPVAADHLPRQVVSSMAQHPLAQGFDGQSSRRVISTHNLQVWLVPSRRDLCEVQVQSGPRVPARTGFGAGCITIAGAEKYGIVAAGKTLQAILPDGTSKLKLTFNDGRSVLLTPNANGIILYTPRQVIRSYSFTSPAGARINHQVVIPPRPPHGPKTPTPRG